MKNAIGTSLLAVVLLAFGVGCAPKTDGVTPGSSAPPGDKSAASKGAEPTAPNLATIPADLKHDGYAYNGFDKTEPLTYLFSRMQGDKPGEGTQTSELKSTGTGEATFTVKRSGALMAIGDEELVVKPDGVYLVSTSLGSPKSPVMLMPAKLAVGTVWDYDYELDTSAAKTGGSRMSFKGKARAVREEKIKVAAGEFDTLMVSETATMDNSGVKGTVSSKSWYAKGIGVVQMKMEVKDSKGRIVTSTIELSGTGGK